ncbi:hypothetical protein BDR04DRAFT_1172443 [Suillus decipiens]|nr:hypothetical protein BDR04DRAFT_1172443 [Suillus decipiens]
MSCTPSATATEYTTITTSTTSTSFSQSVVSNQGAVTTIVQQTCIATGTLSGSNSTGCLSSAAVTQVNTIGGGAVTTQVPIIVTVPVTQTEPRNTLFASCSGASTPSQTSTSTTSQSSSSSTFTPVTTSVLIETTPAPSVITQSSSTTLSNGDVIATVVTTTSTLPASSIYVPSVISSPTPTSTQSGSGSGTDVAPIVGGVLGGFFGLIALVSALWYFCRRRRSWDDIFEQEALGDDEFDSPIALRRDRNRNKLDLSAEPKPYQYGLVGHVTPPPGSGSLSSVRQSHNPSFSNSVASTHSRNTSVTPLLGISSAPGNASKASISGSMHATQSAAAQRHLSATSQSTSQSSMGPRSASVVSTSNSATPLLDVSGPSLPSSSNRVDELGAFDPLNRTGSPAPVIDRRVLQVISDDPQPSKPSASPAPASVPVPVPTPTPASSSAPARPPRKRAPKAKQSNSVVVHTDAGLVSPNTGSTTANEPPPYSRE